MQLWFHKLVPMRLELDMGTPKEQGLHDQSMPKSYSVENTENKDDAASANSLDMSKLLHTSKATKDKR